MAEEVRPETIKATQDILGKFIKRPLLTEKLLKKPPFRFLHDICTSVMKETGFFVGVLNGPEDKIENIKDKEGKIAFLLKVISAVETASNTKLNVKPSKIVAGLEATKTNELLQALGKALKKQKLENKATKSLKSKSVRSKSKEPKEDQPDKKQPSNKSLKQTVESNANEINNIKKQSIETKSAIAPTKQTKKKNDEAQVVNKKIKDTQLEEKNQNDLTKFEESPNIAVELINLNGAGESLHMTNTNTTNINGTDKLEDQSLTEHQEAKDQMELNEDLKRKYSAKQKHRRSSITNSAGPVQPSIDHVNTDYSVKKTDNERMELKESKLYDGKNLMSNQESFSLEQTKPLSEQNRTVPSPSGQLNYPKKDTSLTREGTVISRPKTGIRSTTVRPASARPAAPRIRERSDVVAVEETKKPTSGKINLIVDKEINNEAEDDNLISLETTNDILLQEISMPPPLSANAQTEHGHLVEQILEVQKELEDHSRVTIPEEKPEKTEIEWESDRSSEIANRDIEKLRSNIQTLTRSANPLGKLLDFFQEDIDIIQRELDNWKNKNSSLFVEIAHEKSITEQFVEPLKIHLKEIQQSIDEQFEQISHVKANIIRNNKKIRKLLTGL